MNLTANEKRASCNNFLVIVIISFIFDTINNRMNRSTLTKEKQQIIKYFAKQFQTEITKLDDKKGLMKNIVAEI